MSFTPFPPHPTTSPLPTGTLTVQGPTPRASTEAGATRPVGSAAVSGGASHANTEAGGWMAGTALPYVWRVWLEVVRLLEPFEPEARDLLWRVFAQTIEAAQASRMLPEAARRWNPSVLFQHLTCPRLQEKDLCQQDRAALHWLLRVAFWLAIRALEARILLAPEESDPSLLAEQCTQMARIYRELKRRLGASNALVVLWGEVRLLRHRGSTAAEQLLFA